MVDWFSILFWMLSAVLLAFGVCVCVECKGVGTGVEMSICDMCGGEGAVMVWRGRGYSDKVMYYCDNFFLF